MITLRCVYLVLLIFQSILTHCTETPVTFPDFCRIQWNLDLSFFKGTEKTNDECGQTINPENYYTM